MKKPTISIIICTYYFHKRNEKLQKLLDVLVFLLQKISHEVIIVDNGGGVLDVETNQSGLNVVIIKEPKIGLSNARNSGIKASSGGILVFFDDDIIPAKNYLTILLKRYEENPQVMCIGGAVLLRREGKTPSWMTDYFTRFIVPPAFPNEFTQKKSPFYIIGSNMTFRREVFFEFGLFDTDLGRIGKNLLSGEDTELILRLPEQNVYIEPGCLLETEINFERLSYFYFIKRIYWQGISDAIMVYKNRNIVLYDVQELYISRGFLSFVFGKVKKLVLSEFLCVCVRFFAFWFEICKLKIHKPLGYLRSQYGIKFTNQIILTKGLLNENSILKDENNKNYFLKKNRPENYDKLSYIENVETFFSKNGLPVILPIQTKDKRPHSEYGNDRYTLYPYIKDIQPERDFLTDNQIIQLAETLAKIHKVGESVKDEFKNEEKSTWNKEKVLKKIDEILIRITDKTDFDILARDILTLRKEFIENNTVKYEDLQIQNSGLLHGDYHDQNVFFDKDERISYVFDFEKACYGSSYTELVRTLLLVCFNHTYELENFRKAKLFLLAYNAMYPIKKDDFAGAYQAHRIKAFHSTWIEGEHYLKGNTKLDSLLFPNYQTLKFFSERSNEILELLSC